MKFVVGQRVDFCFAQPDVVKARCAMVSDTPCGQATVGEVIEGPINTLYRLDDLEVCRGEKIIADRMGKAGLWAKDDEVFLAPFPIGDKTTLGEVRVMLNKATEHVQDEGGWSSTYDCGTSKISSDTPYWEYVKDYRFIAVFQVEGGSEGHYVHIDAISGVRANGETEGVSLFLLKTFGGLEQAQLIQNTVQVLLSV
jgi:hypothetical protein